MLLNAYETDQIYVLALPTSPSCGKRVKCCSRLIMSDPDVWKRNDIISEKGCTRYNERTFEHDAIKMEDWIGFYSLTLVG